MEQLYIIVLAHFLYATRPHRELVEGPTSLGNALAEAGAAMCDIT